MEHFEIDLADASVHRVGAVRPDGWRKVSPATLRADAYAEAGQAVQVDKGRAVVALKRVGPHIGLKAADLLLIDTLAAFTQPQDWEAGHRPIVWASNAYLMERTGFSLSALKRHARRLAEHGVIAFQDSPNGKRWGRRDTDGVIVEAYGFDLSPLAARVAEFDALHEDLQAERARCQRLKRQITVARRMIRARLEAALCGAMTGPWEQLQSAFREALAALPRRAMTSWELAQLLGRFSDLLRRVERSFLSATTAKDVVETETETVSDTEENAADLDPRKAGFDPHIPITNKLHPVICRPGEDAPDAPSVEETIDAAPSDTDHHVKNADTTESLAPTVSMTTMLQACPEFMTFARSLGGNFRDWADIHRAAGSLAPMVGIQDTVWMQAQDRLGHHRATAALVLVFDKLCRGEIVSPGGYLRGMIRKAGAGELNLERSFYGRLKKVST